MDCRVSPRPALQSLSRLFFSPACVTLHHLLFIKKCYFLLKKKALLHGNNNLAKVEIKGSNPFASSKSQPHL